MASALADIAAAGSAEGACSWLGWLRSYQAWREQAQKHISYHVSSDVILFILCDSIFPEPSQRALYWRGIVTTVHVSLPLLGALENEGCPTFEILLECLLCRGLWPMPLSAYQRRLLFHWLTLLWKWHSLVWRLSVKAWLALSYGFGYVSRLHF